MRASLSLDVQTEVQKYQVMMPILHQILPAGLSWKLDGKIQSWCGDNDGGIAVAAAAGAEVKKSVFVSAQGAQGTCDDNQETHFSRITRAAHVLKSEANSKYIDDIMSG